jgi:hypothetical protein
LLQFKCLWLDCGGPQGGEGLTSGLSIWLSLAPSLPLELRRTCRRLMLLNNSPRHQIDYEQTFAWNCVNSRFGLDLLPVGQNAVEEGQRRGHAQRLAKPVVVCHPQRRLAAV